MEKHYLSADDYLRDQWRLAELVRGGGWRPDFLVGLWRGGAPVAIAVHEFLKCTGWDVRHIPLKCASYTGIGQNEGKVVFTFGDEIFGLFRAGDKVLFIDDVFDTGKTSEFGFNDYAVIVSVFDDLAGDLDILGKGLRGSVDHYGSKAAVDTALTELE